MKRKHFVIAVVAAAVLASGLTAFTVNQFGGPKTSEVRVVEFAGTGVGNHFTSYEKDNYPDLTYAAENAVKAVVNVEVVKEVRYNEGSNNPFFFFFGVPEGYDRPREQRGGGSGVIISTDGYIVTNNHVIDGASKLKVTLNDNRSFDAKLVGTDPATDVALIKIEAADLPTLIFGSSNDLRLGEWVLAIGSPYELQSTVTAGIVSAKSRDMRDGGTGDLSITSFIQTDAAVNPGNSGGALVNARGEVVGINTMIKSPTGSFAGYSFAIPSSIVQKVVVDLKEYGVAQRAMLGIQYQAIDNGKIYDAEKREMVDVEEQKGLYVFEVVPESAAEGVGIKKGDVLIEIDGIALENSATLQEYIATKRPNDNVDVTIKRDGKVKQMEVVLRNNAGKTELVTGPAAAEVLGGTFADISDKEKKQLRIDGGVQVKSIKENGVLSETRVRTGYIITQINDTQIRSTRDLAKISDEITFIDGVYPDGRSASYTLRNR